MSGLVRRCLRCVQKQLLGNVRRRRSTAIRVRRCTDAAFPVDRWLPHFNQGLLKQFEHVVVKAYQIIIP